MSLDSLKSAAERLAATVGLGGLSELCLIPQGGNNRVYKVTCGGRPLLLKEYFHHRNDPRDRGGTEFAFSRFAWDRGIRCVPEPMAWDPAARVGLYEFLDGRKLQPCEVNQQAVKCACDFFVELNSFRFLSEAKSLPDASEACFSIADHLETVGGRIQRLRSIPITEDVDEEAEAFVLDALCPRWEEVKGEVESQTQRHCFATEVLDGERRLSPSDFGFHNALLTPSRLRFFDFEYAGWDDPAKTVCDFFCQPAVPAPQTYFEDFAALATGGSESCRRRVDLLLPVYRLKWCCIMLNDFLPTDGERRAFAGGGALTGSGKRLQLTRAMSLFKIGAP